MGQEVAIARVPTDDEVRALLKDLEWSWQQVVRDGGVDLRFPACPVCFGTARREAYGWLRAGHSRTCPLDLAIRFWRVP